MSSIQFKQAIAVCIFTTTILHSITITARAATYYVDSTGNDANTCAQAQTQSAPRQTIPAGVACLAGGDTLIVKTGTYTNQEIRNPPAGTANAYTVIMGDPSGARPILRPDAAATQRGFYCSRGETCRYIEMRYFEVDHPYEYLKLEGSDGTGYSHHLRILDNVFHDSRASGFLINSSNTGFLGGDHLIRGNTFYGTGSQTPGYGPGFTGIYNPGNRTIIEHNVFHNNISGIKIWRKDSAGVKSIHNVIIRNNVFRDMGLTNTDTWQQGAVGYNAVTVSVPGGGHKIYNNLVYRSGDTSKFKAFLVNMYGLQSDKDASAPTLFYNNTIYDLKHANAAAFIIEPNMGGPHVVKNNIAYLAGKGIIGGVQSNNLTTNPSFTKPAEGDFTIQSRSAAIDAGEILDIVTTDFRGVRRYQGAGYDIGAYEMGDEDGPRPPKHLSAN